MRTITFYSYKGGTGRTLAVANTARFLARFGLKVFVLDFDLEAPGLHYKLGLRTHEAGALLQGEADKPIRGLVDFIHSFITSAKVPELDEYVTEIGDLAPDFTGKIWLMPAGDAPSAEYSRQLADIHLSNLFNPGDESPAIPVAVPLFLDLKARIEHDYQADYLLIDSRTGVTEIGGVAVRLLPDAVVCLIHQNPENRAGARGVLQSIRSAPVEGSAPIEIALALARIPDMALDEEKRLLDEVRDYFNAGPESLNLDEVIPLHSDPDLQVREFLLVGARTTANESTLLRDYFKLFRRLGLDKHLNPVQQGVLRELAQADRENAVRPLLVARRSLSGESAVAKIHMRERIEGRPRLVLKVVAPEYLERKNYKNFIGRVRAHLFASFSSLPEMDELAEVRWDLLAVHLREGVLDFCDDLYYLTESRNHLVEVLQIGWCRSFVAYAGTTSPIYKTLRSAGKVGFLETMTAILANFPGLAVCVHGDTAAASEANRHLGGLLNAASLVSRESEEELLGWLRHDQDRIVICDRIIADRLNSLSGNEGEHGIARQFTYSRPVPVGIVYPREDREWRKDIAQAIATSLVENTAKGHGSITKYWDNVAADCKGNGIDALSLADLRTSLLLDLPFEKALEWDEKFQTAKAREAANRTGVPAKQEIDVR